LIRMSGPVFRETRRSGRKSLSSTMKLILARDLILVNFSGCHTSQPRAAAAPQPWPATPAPHRRPAAGRRTRLHLPCSAAPYSGCCCSGPRLHLTSSACGRALPPLLHRARLEGRGVGRRPASPFAAPPGGGARAERRAPQQANTSEERGSAFFHRLFPPRYFASPFASLVGDGCPCYSSQ
jgi:hypothetical protein